MIDWMRLLKAIGIFLGLALVSVGAYMLSIYNMGIFIAIVIVFSSILITANIYFTLDE